jgi:hypothetical protein
LASHPDRVLTFEAGLGNDPAASVPELPPGVLLLAGLGVLAAAMRRSAAARAGAWRVGGQRHPVHIQPDNSRSGSPRMRAVMRLHPARRDFA